jgi:alpha-L-rhamnosidase
MNHKNWIKSPVAAQSEVVSFQKKVATAKKIEKAQLTVSAIGVYRAMVNGKDVTSSVLNPGYTSYTKRVQYQVYDVTALLDEQTQELNIQVGNGWAVGYLFGKGERCMFSDHTALIAQLDLTYTDGSLETVTTDESWSVWSTQVEFAENYHGETVNLLHEPKCLGNAVIDPVAQTYPLIPQQGELIVEQEHIAPAALIVTPKGERVVDFGQNMTGYVQFTVKGKKGDRIVTTCAEVLDKDGNFYNANYRTAANRMTYILDGEENVFKPHFSFQGFRYIRLDEYPFDEVDLDGICAIVVHSNLTRTGFFSCGNDKINQLYHNTVWGQKSNYVDVPTDCPQRDERLGWTGDAQVFCRTAALNFDVSKFFKKWLGDMRADQGVNGEVGGVIPEKLSNTAYRARISAAWGDAATVIPWELYRAYGDKSFLEDNFEMMRRWVEYQHATGEEEYLWLGGYHYGDWLAMDAGEDSYVGATSNDLIASAFFYHSTDLLVRAGEVLGKDMTYYKEMKQNIFCAFRRYFMENGSPKEELPFTERAPEGRSAVIDTVRKGMTQTALVLILHFGLCTDEERPVLEAKLAELIASFDGLMSTGFVGTPYLLHVLTAAGRDDLAYQLLFEERNPSWLYSVVHGGTTMWEHWNSLKEDGSFWSTAMNSFNHYAYGSVCDWIYGVVAGITVSEDGVGYRKFTLAPHPDRRLGHVNCRLNTVAGEVVSNWYYSADSVHYEFTVPCGSVADMTLPDGRHATLGAGTYHFTAKA